MALTHSKLSFPPAFAWGYAAAAPQIEGASSLHGKGPSIWDAFAARPGTIHGGDDLSVACDHYNLYAEDFALMRELGARHYRLSVAWPRIYPMGDGAVNYAGLDYYDRLIDSLLAEGITPWVTLFHWDLPDALEGQHGGWRSRRIPELFGRYADTVVKTLGDRVKNWITINETVCFTRLAYGGHDKAPGANEPAGVVNQTFHHALLAHGQGVRAVREHGGPGARVGITDNPAVLVPVTETPADIAAARETFAWANERVLGAIHRGGYAPALLEADGRDAPRWQPGDFDLISAPTDFLGLNIYTGAWVQAGPDGRPRTLSYPPAYPRADSPWLYHVPQSLYWGPRFCAELYRPASIYITENGAGYDDPPPVDGEVHDLHRRDLVRNYLRELHRAIHDGVPVDGYFLWSFMDNFEWQDGYARRFGAVYCDFRTQRRTPKLTARWYREVMWANALV
ncbi:MAG: GH1 family beta-glucosidase [Opitutaceae bacterium]|nr:GH1 family beta-glucosidase [Opitutaceae bacterium]